MLYEEYQSAQKLKIVKKNLKVNMNELSKKKKQQI